MRKGKIEQNKNLILNMINKIDAISNFAKDEFIIIKLAKFQQQLYKLEGAREYYVSEIDYKINDVIDDILKLVMKHKDSDALEELLQKSLTNLIELMDTRVTVEYLNV